MKTFAYILIFLAVLFIFSGYWMSDDVYFSDLTARNQIDTPEKAFAFVNENTDFVTGNSAPVPYTTPRYMLEKRHLWCDEARWF